MEKIEEILKLEKELSRKIEEAERKAQEIISSGQREAEKIIASYKDEVRKYNDQIFREVEEAMEFLEEEQMERFGERKRFFKEKYQEVKDDLINAMKRKILGYDS